MSKAFKWLDGKGRKALICLVALLAVFLTYGVSASFTGDNLVEAVKWIVIAFSGGNVGEHFANRGGNV